jgi:hypothetical protein
MADFPVSANVRPAINDIDKLIASLRAAGKQAGLTEDEIQKVVTTAQKAGTEGAGGINKINSELGNLGGIAKTVGPALAGVFALDKLKDFVGQVVNITAEFQKFEAVLTNTLGSNSAARRALADITKFASVTPFSVRELTDSFVRLANQGFKPSIQELRKLGDLASSTGKQFDQLTEAIIDAQTGEFERLKEFGIRASKAGDQVTFSFKGVQTQTEFTSDAIRQYILTLGDLDGVSGSMAAISQTLGGQISNLGDSWDQFLKTLGDGNKGALSGSVSLLDKALKIATDLVTTTEQRNAQTVAGQSGAVLDEFKGKSEVERAQMKQKIYERILDLQIKIAASEREYRESVEERRSNRVNMAEFNLNKQQLAIAQESIALISNLQKEEEKVNAKKEKGVKITNDQINAEQRRLEKVRDFARELEEIEMRWSIVSSTKRPLQDIARAEDTIGPIQPLSLKPVNQTQQNDTTQDKKDLRQAEFDFAVNLINTLSAIQNEADQMERDRLRSKYEYDLRLAGNNETAKAKIKAEFDKKDRELQQRQAQRARDMAVFDIFLNTGRGIMAALTSVPPNVPLSIFIGATGLLQAGLALSRPLPKFKDGVFDLIGPGTETSDSILARLSAHETVVPARKSRKFKDILKPLVEDENITYNDLKGIIDKNIPNSVRGDLFFKLKQESDPVMHEVRDILRDIKNKPTSHVNIDKHGFFEYQEKELHRKKVYKDKISW